MIRKVGKNGGTVTTLSSGLYNPARIAVDSSNLYWTDAGSSNIAGSGSVNKIGINDGNATTFVYGLTNPIGIAVDSTNVYFTESTNTGTLKKTTK
jgi:hypothetical protein